MNVTVACPRGYEPNLVAYNQAVEDAKATGAKIEVVHDPVEGVKGADAVYTDVWASMGQEAEAAERKRIFSPYQVNEALMAHAKSDAIFLHCLPAHRGDEVTDGVIVALPGSTQNVQVQQSDQVKRTLKVKHGTSVSVFVARDLDFSSVEY